jgi:hypothetical protein
MAPVDGPPHLTTTGTPRHPQMDKGEHGPPLIGIPSREYPKGQPSVVYQPIVPKKPYITLPPTQKRDPYITLPQEKKPSGPYIALPVNQPKKGTYITLYEKKLHGAYITLYPKHNEDTYIKLYDKQTEAQLVSKKAYITLFAPKERPPYIDLPQTAPPPAALEHKPDKSEQPLETAQHLHGRLTPSHTGSPSSARKTETSPEATRTAPDEDAEFMYASAAAGNGMQSRGLVAGRLLATKSPPQTRARQQKWR